MENIKITLTDKEALELQQNMAITESAGHSILGGAHKDCIAAYTTGNNDMPFAPDIVPVNSMFRDWFQGWLGLDEEIAIQQIRLSRDNDNIIAELMVNNRWYAVIKEKHDENFTITVTVNGIRDTIEKNDKEHEEYMEQRRLQRQQRKATEDNNEL